MPIPPVSDSGPTVPAPLDSVPASSPAAPEGAPSLPEGAPSLPGEAPGMAPAEAPVPPRAAPGIAIPTSALPAGVVQGPIVAVPRPVAAGRGLGAGEVVGLVALYTAVLVVAGLALGSGAPPQWTAGSFQALLLGQLVAGALVLALGLRWSGAAVREAFPTTLPHPLTLPALGLAALGLGLLQSEVIRAPLWEPFYRQPLPFLGEPAGAIAGALSIVVVAPVVEELVFRGLLLRGLLRRHSPTLAASVTAVVFALYHLDPWQAAAAFPLGLGLAWLTIASGSVLPAILAHVLLNAASLLDAPLVRTLGYGPLELATMMHLPATLLLLATAAAGLGCVLLWRQHRSSRATPAFAVRVAPPPEVLRVSFTVLAALVLVGVAERETRQLAPSAPPPDEGCYRASIPAAAAAALFPGDTAAMPALRLTRWSLPVGLQASPKYVVLSLDPAPQRRARRVVYWTPATDGVVIVGRLPTGRALFVLLTRQGGSFTGEVTYSRRAGAAAPVGDAMFLHVPCPGD